jgi:putative hydroxymethylpyrimidine transport system substrate-binding protein
MRKRALTAAIAAALVVTACGSGDTVATPAAGSNLIGADRCAQNQEAGSITYLTSYDLGGAVGVLNMVAADALGYFRDLCLDVTVRPKADSNAQLVSAGTAQIAGVSSASDVLTAADNGANIAGVMTYGNVGQVELVTMDDGSITSLKDLEGKILGYKGAMPAQLTSMLVAAGVDVGRVQQVSVGFDPAVLPQGAVQALQVYKDNEPRLLRGQGHAIREWNPADFGVQGTFSVMIANTDFGREHPIAVEDFVRASIAAMEWIDESDANLDQAIAWSQERSAAGYNAVNEKARWKDGSALARAHLLDGHGVGFQTPSVWQPEADSLLAAGKIKKPADVTAAQANQYVDAVYDGPRLIWPAPGGTAGGSS